MLSALHCDLSSGFQVGLGLLKLAEPLPSSPEPAFPTVWNGAGPPQGSSVQINSFLPLFLCLAKGLWSKWPDTGSRAGGCHKPVFLGDSGDPCLTFRSANVLFEMASGGESTGLQTHVPHLPLVEHKGWGAAPAGERADCSSCCCHQATRECGFRGEWRERVRGRRGGTWGQGRCHWGGGSRWWLVYLLSCFVSLSLSA